MDEMFEPRAEVSAKALRRRERKANKRKEAAASKALEPRTARQAELLAALNSHPVVFALGPAGTGKTYVPARNAMRLLQSPGSPIEKIVITRPTVAPSRHRMGYLPGGGAAKMKPWLVPIMDGMRDETSQAQIDKLTQDGKIEIVPFEHMRGRSFHNAAILLDEGQNCSFSDLELLITRTGEESTLVISGDTHQVDIDDSGLARVARMVAQHGLNAYVVEFDHTDVTRSAVAAEWVKAFRAEAVPSVVRH